MTRQTGSTALVFGILVGCIAVVGPARAGAVPAWMEAALALIEQLGRAAPTDQHGLPTRRYELADLDRDGVMEVLEIVPHYERSPGFLNVELEPAFEWIDVYEYRAGAYREGTARQRAFLQSRRAHYELWLRLLQNPSNLGRDSQELARANRSEFAGILNRYLRRIDDLMRGVP